MEIKENVTLAPYTTFKIGGPARYFCEVHSTSELTEVVAFAHEHRHPTLVLGGGSNVLISDSGFSGVVFRMMIEGVAWEEHGNEVFVTAGAGVVWDELVAASVEHACWGLENLSAIPGSVGASVVQNIGAYGAEVSRVVEWVEVFDTRTRSVRKIARADCAFGYRDSVWKHEGGEGLIVTQVRFRLAKHGEPNIAYKDLKEFFARAHNEYPTQEEVRNAVLEIRSGKFPDLARYGTAGSFFKHPVVSAEEAKIFLQKFPDAPTFPAGEGMVKLSAGWIIDHVLALRGVKVGNVGTWEKQALVLVNYGGARAEEVKHFSQMIRDRVRDATGVVLESEVVHA
jgi:UDP-N-acetylmuramate dehydrogenase